MYIHYELNVCGKGNPAYLCMYIYYDNTYIFCGCFYALTYVYTYMYMYVCMQMYLFLFAMCKLHLYVWKLYGIHRCHVNTVLEVHTCTCIYMTCSVYIMYVVYSAERSTVAKKATFVFNIFMFMKNLDVFYAHKQYALFLIQHTYIHTSYICF